MLPQLHSYQRKCVDFIKTHPYCGLFLDMGLGKTLITLTAFSELGAAGQLNGHILIIAPKNIARSTWVDEIEKWQIPVRCKSLIVNDKGKSLSRQERLNIYASIPNEPPTLWFINRELLKDLIDNTSTWYFPHIVIDESQGFKSHKSQRFKALQAVRPYISRVIELSGTPAPNGPLDLWSQIWLLDTGARLGKNITTYRRTFFRETRWRNDIPIDWEVLDQATEDEIYRRISDLVISLKNTNLQLPSITYNTITVHMTLEEKETYKHLVDTKVLHITKDDVNYHIAVDNPAILTAKLSQLASGTIYLNETDIVAEDDDPNQTIFTPTTVSQQPVPKTVPKYDDNGNREYAVLHTHKLEHAQYIVDNTDSPVLIAYHFKSDKAELIRYFNELDSKNTGNIKYNVEVFDGSPEMIKRWNARQIRVMLIQPASAGHGLNLQQGGHTLIWYTLPWSLEEYLQTNKRLHRQGQTEPVIIHHLLTKGTIDTHILNVLEGKETQENALMEAVKLT